MSKYNYAFTGDESATASVLVKGQLDLEAGTAQLSGEDFHLEVLQTIENKPVLVQIKNDTGYSQVMKLRQAVGKKPWFWTRYNGVDYNFKLVQDFKTKEPIWRAFENADQSAQAGLGEPDGLDMEDLDSDDLD